MQLQWISERLFNIFGEWIFRFFPMLELGSGAKMEISKIALQSRGYSDSYHPWTSKVRGSNDGLNFTLLTTATATFNGLHQWELFDVPANSFYSYLKFVHTSTNSSGNEAWTLGELLLWGNVEL